MRGRSARGEDTLEIFEPVEQQAPASPIHDALVPLSSPQSSKTLSVPSPRESLSQEDNVFGIFSDHEEPLDNMDIFEGISFEGLLPEDFDISFNDVD